MFQFVSCFVVVVPNSTPCPVKFTCTPGAPSRGCSPPLVHHMGTVLDSPHGSHRGVMLHFATRWGPPITLCCVFTIIIFCVTAKGERGGGGRLPGVPVKIYLLLLLALPGGVPLLNGAPERGCHGYSLPTRPEPTRIVPDCSGGGVGWNPFKAVREAYVVMLPLCPHVNVLKSCFVFVVVTTDRLLNSNCGKVPTVVGA